MKMKKVHLVIVALQKSHLVGQGLAVTLWTKTSCVKHFNHVELELKQLSSKNIALSLL